MAAVAAAVDVARGQSAICGEEIQMQCACTSASACSWRVKHGLHAMSMSMSNVRTAVRFFPEGAGPLWARAVTRGHAPLYEESWTLIS